MSRRDYESHLPIPAAHRDPSCRIAEQGREVPDKQLAYSVEQACAKIGICRAFLYRLWDQGLGPPHFKVGRRTLVSAKALDEWIQQQEDKATKQPSFASILPPAAVTPGPNLFVMRKRPPLP